MTLEEEMKLQLDAAGIDYEMQYQFVDGRKFRADFAIITPPHKIIIEVQGGTWMAKSGHNTGHGLMRDYAKSNAANLLGWCYLQFTAQDVHDGTALALIQQAMNSRQFTGGYVAGEERYCIHGD